MLQKLNFKPGFNKQVTSSGAESQWVDGDFVRFRYGLPEKIGGWEQLTVENLTLPGVARAQHSWSSLAGEKYSVVGTTQGLFIYYGEDFYDITPLDTGITGATFDATSGSPTVTVNKTSHGLAQGRYITFSSVTVPSGSGYATTDFTENTFEISSVTSNTFNITMPTNSAASTSGSGSAQIDPYIIIGPTFQTAGYGWGTYVWGDSTWGTERTISDVVLDPGIWSLDNFGEVLVATIHNGKTFTWNAGASSPRNIRASQTTSGFETNNNPTRSRFTLVSDRDRHLFHFGTETTIGDASTQDPMFIRFANQEQLNVYEPTATNTAGTFRLDTGNFISAATQGKDYVFVLTDNAAYVIQFVGPPFTFSVKQVGTNCGCIGQNAVSYSNGKVFWMSGEGGFFVFDGTVKAIPCLVEDFVFDDLNTTANQLINVGLNNLFGEITWFYCTSSSTIVNRSVTYNYLDSRPERPVWTTGSLARGSWTDSSVFGLPHATSFNASDNSSYDVIGNTDGTSIYFEHEKGTDQVASGTVTAITSNIESGDFDITQARTSQGQQTGVATFKGDGEYIMKIRRFIPDFLSQTGDTQVTLQLRDYPNNSQSSSPLGPFTITSSTDKVDTRARARAIALKVANTGVSQSWKLGTFRLDTQPDGRR